MIRDFIGSENSFIHDVNVSLHLIYGTWQHIMYARTCTCVYIKH